MIKRLALALVVELHRVGKDGHSAIDWLRRLVSVAEVHKVIYVGNKDGGSAELTMLARHLARAESNW
eukprot:jgi/Tetstr1/441313/TSEL_029564.t1